MILAVRSAKFKADLIIHMASPQPTSPHWLLTRLGDDLNWWVAETNPGTTARQRSILDPRQVVHLIESLDRYESHGVTREQIASAFQVYAAESELADGRLRLTAVDEPIHHPGEQLFALPLLTDDGEGPYTEFLETLGVARIQLLNATHAYARDCTESEMYDELDTLHADRYFGDDTLHVFDEINEILTWSPAEWDDSAS